jgi:hypothetical protein
VVANPPLDELAHREGVSEYVATWCDEMASIGSLLRRVSNHTATFEHVKEDEAITASILHITSGVAEACLQCAKVVHNIGRFDFLVLSDIDSSFAAYDASKTLPSPLVHVDSAELPVRPRFARAASIVFASVLFGRLHDLASLGTTPDPTFPTIEAFDSFLSVYATAASELAAMDSTTDVHWISVNITPAQTALKSWASNWIHKFGSVVLHRLEETIATVRIYFDRTEVTDTHARTLWTSDPNPHNANMITAPPRGAPTCNSGGVAHPHLITLARPVGRHQRLVRRGGLR